MNQNFLAQVVLANALLNNQPRVKYRSPAEPEGFDEWSRQQYQFDGLYKKTKKMREALITCTHCHTNFTMLQGIDTKYALEPNETMTTCPECKRRIKLIYSHPRRFNWDGGVQKVLIYSVINGLDCYRLYHCHVWTRVDDDKCKHEPCYYEYARLWHGPNGERISTQDWVSGYMYARTDAGNLNKEMASDYDLPKNNDDTFINKFFDADLVYPEKQVLDKRDDYHLPVLTACLNKLKSRAILHRVIYRVFHIPMIETLVKSNQIAAAAFLSNVSFERGKFEEQKRVEDWHPGERHLSYVNEIHIHFDDVVSAFKVANRHGYKIKDPKMYTEYLDELFRLDMDLHNPKYLCPEDLAAAHERTGMLLDRKDAARISRLQEYYRNRREIDEAARAEQIAREREANIIKAAEYEDTYRRTHGKYFDIKFESKNCTYHVLQSVDEFRQEAEAMSHCVFRCGYYKKENSIILSCRRKGDDSRISTIELEFHVNEFYIEQIRGEHNHVPLFYKESFETLKAHLKDFMNARRRTETITQPTTAIAV